MFANLGVSACGLRTASTTGAVIQVVPFIIAKLMGTKNKFYYLEIGWVYFRQIKISAK